MGCRETRGNNNMTMLREQLQAAAALPPDRPMGMPGGFYTSDAQFQHECNTVLRKGWHCIGRVDEVPLPGDFFTLQLLNEPLLVVRGDDAQIRVFANVCRHRGMPLAEGHGQARRFMCSYHAWTYRRDGSLLRAPMMENSGFDPKSCRLHSHRVQIWNGFIYVTLDRNAQAFEHPDLDQLLANYDPEAYRLVHVASEVWHTNWKCLVENFMEGYHLSVVHPRTLHSYTPTGLARKLVSGDGFTSYAAQYPEGIPSRGMGSASLTDEERMRSTLFGKFPTQVVSVAASLLVSLSIFPLTVNSIRVKWTMSTFGNDLDAATIEQRIALWEAVNTEDREKLEKMQVALASEYAQPGPLAGADYEGTVRDFQVWLAAQDRACEM